MLLRPFAKHNQGREGGVSMRGIRIIGRHSRSFSCPKQLGRRTVRVSPWKLHDFFYGRGMAKDQAREDIFKALYGFSPVRPFMSKKRFYVFVHANDLTRWEMYKQALAPEMMGIPAMSACHSGGGGFHYPCA